MIIIVLSNCIVEYLIDTVQSYMIASCQGLNFLEHRAPRHGALVIPMFSEHNMHHDLV